MLECKSFSINITKIEVNHWKQLNQFRLVIHERLVNQNPQETQNVIVNQINLETHETRVDQIKLVNQR